MSTAARNAWVPAVLGCSEPAGTAWAKAGPHVLELGDEAVLQASAFSLDGRSMRGIRQAVGRGTRACYSCEVRRAGDVPSTEWAAVRDASGRWRVGALERGFSMALGRLGDHRDGEAVLATARDSTGERRALLHFVPWGSTGLSLDVMRRHRQTDNGLSEALIVALFQAAPGPSCAADLLEFRGLPLGTGTRGWAGRGSGSSGLETTAAAGIAVVADRPAATPNSGRVGPAMPVQPDDATSGRGGSSGGGISRPARPALRPRAGRHGGGRRRPARFGRDLRSRCRCLSRHLLRTMTAPARQRLVQLLGAR